MQVRLTFGGGADDDAATVIVTAAAAATAASASASASASATSVEEEAGFVTQVLKAAIRGAVARTLSLLSLSHTRHHPLLQVFKAAIRDPTTTAVLRVDTIDSTTLLPCVVGTAVLKMFVASKEDRAQVQ